MHEIMGEDMDADNPAAEPQQPDPPTKKSRIAMSDDDLYGSFLAQPNADVDEVDAYLRMTAEDIGDDTDLLLWWKTQVRNI
jgi:hypothetical protein